MTKRQKNKNGAPIIFLDRDGVINKKPPEHQYVTSFDEFEVLDGVYESVKRFNDAGYKVVVVTNQQCVAKGIITMEKLIELHTSLIIDFRLHDAQIDSIFCCPHLAGTCNCRKPQIGMFLKAEEEFGKVDKDNSFMIGDSQSDILAGKNYGVKTILIGNGEYGQDKLFSCMSDVCDYVVGKWELY